MAYLKSIDTVCFTAGCSRRATMELMDRFNGSRGKYCTPCSRRAMTRLQGDEMPESPSQPEANTVDS